MTEPDQPALAFDPDNTPGHTVVLEDGAPPSTHVPTQELFTDADGKAEYRDKPLTTLTADMPDKKETGNG